ncbi:MAG: hypothetical protein ACOH10_07980 [Rhodoglobus sp.]
MKWPRFALETVVRIRTTNPGVDPYGDPLPPTTVREDITQCIVEPTGSAESTARGRVGVVTSWTISAPPGTDILSTDQVEVRGVTCNVEGEIGDWRTNAGGPESVTIRAKRAAG